MDFEIRDARPADQQQLLALLPRLAAFNVPPHREPQHLWEHDAELLQRCLAGAAPQCFAQVAEGDTGILGVTLTTLRPDLLNDEPGAHLEVIAVSAVAEGQGVAKALLAAAEAEARLRGAASITLHVIESNERARGFYEYSGYVAEMLRYIKPL